MHGAMDNSFFVVLKKMKNADFDSFVGLGVQSQWSEVDQT